MLTPGEKMKKRRMAKGMSISKLAHTAGTSTFQVQHFEANDLCPNLITLLKFAKALDVNLNFFQCSIEMAYAIKHDPKRRLEETREKKIPGRRKPKDD